MVKVWIKFGYWKHFDKIWINCFFQLYPYFILILPRFYPNFIWKNLGQNMDEKTRTGLYYRFWNIYKYEPCGWGFMQAKQHPYIIHANTIRVTKQPTIIPVIWLLLRPVACGKSTWGSKSSEFWLAVVASSSHFCSLHL